MNKDDIKMALALVGIFSLLVFIILTVSEAHAEEVNGFYGLDGMFKDPDSIVKLYNSGGFSIKNYDMGIAIYAHPVSKSDMFKFTIMENGKVSRFIVGIEPIEDTEPEKVEPQITERIEPKSSVGSDIAKYDIPTTGRDSNNVDPMILTLKPDMIPVEIRLGDEFEWSASVINARQGNSAKIENATVTLEISRDDYIIRSYSDTTNNAGHVTIKISDISYPEFYPRFCYDVIVTTSYDGYENIWDDDEFLIQYTLGTTSWNPNTDWMSESRWNYLPSSFQQEPRASINWG